MRKFLGIAVLVAGTGGLAYWASTDHAVGMERAIHSSARSVIAGIAYPIRTEVSGRDLRAIGSLPSDREREALRQALFEVEGVRVVDVSDIDLLPVANPFEVAVLKGSAGVEARGVLPSEAVRAQLGGVDGPFADVQLAAGVPDSAWGAALAVGMEGLEVLSSGDLTLSGRVLTFSGSVTTPADQAAIAQIMAALPEGYTYVDALVVLDDGTPLRLDVRLSDGAVRAEGKVPSGLGNTALSARFPDAMVDLEQARVAAQPADWAATAEIALDALDGLSEGRLHINGTGITIEGRGTADAIAQATAALSGVPVGYTVQQNLTVIEPATPVELTVTSDGAQAVASGVYPEGFNPGDTLSLLSLTDTTTVTGDTSEGFNDTAAIGLAALEQLQDGKLTVTEDAIILTGTARSAQSAEVLDGILSRTSAEVTRDITYPEVAPEADPVADPGAAWTLSYRAESGAMVEGFVPPAITHDTLATSLGVPVVGSMDTGAAASDFDAIALDVLAILADILPDLEAMMLTTDGSGTTLDLTALPAIDLDLLAADLAERLPVDVAFSMQRLDPLPQQGATRTNAATGKDEVFLNGFWIPNLTFATSQETCTDLSRNILAQAQVNFLSGSARLDTASVRTLGALAAVALPCTQADLDLEISGHTDASGDPDQNQILSDDRARAVRDALIARGVDARAITSIGYGASQPIATNDTAEGRALNRRTEIDWFEKDAPRDP